MKNIKSHILSLTTLEDGWNFGEGKKINCDSIIIALAIAEELPTYMYLDIEAYPLNDGSISLRIIFKKNLTVGLLIDSENYIDAYIDNENSIKNLGPIKLEELKEFMLRQHNFLKTEAKQCTSEDFYTINSFQSLREHTLQNVSYLGKTSQNCQSSILNVRVQTTKQCASIYVSKGKGLAPSQYHINTGNSRNSYYKRKVA